MAWPEAKIASKLRIDTGSSPAEKSHDTWSYSWRGPERRPLGHLFRQYLSQNHFPRSGTTCSIVVNPGDVKGDYGRVLNVKQAAEHAGVSKSYLDKLRIYGGGPLYIKVGARVVYDQVDVDAWLASKKIANTSQMPLTDAA